MIFVYPPTLDWGYMFQRPQQIARALARRGHHVYFCQKTQTAGKGMESLPSDPGVTIVHDWPAFLQTVHTLQDVVLFMSWSQHRQHLKESWATFKIFDSLDAFPEWEAGDLEAIAVADAVTCTSTALLDQAEKVRGNDGKSILTGNACDPEHWVNPGEPPAWLTAIPSPRVLFCGYVGSWIDASLIQSLSVLCPTYSFVMVGPPCTSTVKSPQLNRPNIYQVGQKTYEELPAIFGACQAGLIPFKTNDSISTAADPIKLYEYLAAGLPVVSTDIPEAHRFEDVVRLGWSPAQIAHLLVDAVENDKGYQTHGGPVKMSDVRRARAREYSWDRVAGIIESLVPKTAEEGETDDASQSVGVGAGTKPSVDPAAVPEGTGNSGVSE